MDADFDKNSVTHRLMTFRVAANKNKHPREEVLIFVDTLVLLR